MAARIEKRKPRKKGRPVHAVQVWIERKKLRYNKHCVHANFGDLITWTLMRRGAPFAIIVKSLESPLEWNYAVSRRRQTTISARVKMDAKPGYYPYAVCVADSGGLIVDDPEIIVPPPRGGR